MKTIISLCAVEGCGPAKKLPRGLCTKHYQRLMRRGSTDAATKPTIEERFWSKVDKSGDCWVWTAAKYSNGYGHFGLSAERGAIAHRHAWEDLRGAIPDGVHIDHTCHNRACVNPAHLRLVTPKQNLENIGVLRRDNTSGVHGVHRYRDGLRWVARVEHHGRQYHVGLFEELEDAKAAVTAKRNELFTHNDRDRIRA